MIAFLDFVRFSQVSQVLLTCIVGKVIQVDALPLRVKPLIGQKREFPLLCGGSVAGVAKGNWVLNKASMQRSVPFPLFITSHFLFVNPPQIINYYKYPYSEM